MEQKLPSRLSNSKPLLIKLQNISYRTKSKLYKLSIIPMSCMPMKLSRIIITAILLPIIAPTKHQKNILSKKESYQKKNHWLFLDKLQKDMQLSETMGLYIETLNRRTFYFHRPISLLFVISDIVRQPIISLNQRCTIMLDLQHIWLHKQF